MYAVIFTAKIKTLDDEYVQTAAKLRELAREKYGCLDFVSLIEGELEIAISYWESLEQIKNWKQDAEHLRAQKQGKHRWYESYQIQITEVVRAYDSNE